MFGIAVTTLGRWSREGLLPYLPTPGGHRRYRRADVDALRERLTPDPVRAAMEQDAVRLYREGWSIRQVARRFECSYGAMRRLLGKHTTLRDRAGR